MTSSTVFVTGANGFIAQTLVSQLLEKGHKVIGQVRSDAKGAQLAELVNNKNFNYVVVPVIEAEHAFDKVLKDHPEVETFYHTASPVSFANDDVENNILIPAINGTKYVLQSIKEHAPQLQHFVYTSSIVALADLLNAPLGIKEAEWSPMTYEQAKTNGMLAYAGSKKFAEQEVWKFRDEHQPKFTIATILPSFVTGPQAFAANLKNLSSTSALFAAAINAKTREELEACIPFPLAIDIRDVARAHISAAENVKANGQRLILSNGTFNADTVLTILNEKYPGKSSLKPNDPVTPTMPDIVDNKLTRSLLGEWIPLVQSLADAIVQHGESGFTLELSLADSIIQQAKSEL
ncbi:uncharacterized protein KQ657_004705 [Scheffersomyces spartinae]|uniref:NAD-dependent epimerase/dehydratase domain-containing protein n=1 Tax=Scheffersomyces spartinae TaxID=45513 RepID=A0A9P8AJ85_9ASCO|nr:uncharacterized protein KQ657_004705 [Scheffersomyces spartinae]KAG7194490.1 hypothetical protein KQ657_004705 [Scheffersomyces spartinae]